MSLRKNLFCLILAVAALIALALWHFNWECARSDGCFPDVHWRRWSLLTPAQAQIGPPAFYTFAPAPARAVEPLPPNEMVEPPPQSEPSAAILPEPVYTLGDLSLDIPIVPLEVTVTSLPKMIMYSQYCWRTRHHGRTECSELKMIIDHQ
jgi:hypothetical protein